MRKGKSHDRKIYHRRWKDMESVHAIECIPSPYPPRYRGSESGRRADGLGRRTRRYRRLRVRRILSKSWDDSVKWRITSGKVNHPLHSPHSLACTRSSRCLVCVYIHWLYFFGQGVSIITDAVREGFIGYGRLDLWGGRMIQWWSSYYSFIGSDW